MPKNNLLRLIMLCAMAILMGSVYAQNMTV